MCFGPQSEILKFFKVFWTKIFEKILKFEKNLKFIRQMSGMRVHKSEHKCKSKDP